MLRRLARSAQRVAALLRKEFLQLLRDPRMRFVLVAPPLIELLLFGYAATYDIRHAEVAVVNHDTTVVSRELLAAVRATGHYTLHVLPDMRAASAAMDRNEVRVILQIPPDLTTRRVVQLVGDGSDPNSAQLIAGELSRVIAETSLVQAAQVPPLRVEERAWFNPNLEDRWYFVPGIMANVVFVATMMLSAMVVVREREFGTLERLLVTPVGRLEFLVAKMVPVACVGLFDALLGAGDEVLPQMTLAIQWSTAEQQQPTVDVCMQRRRRSSGLHGHLCGSYLQLAPANRTVDDDDAALEMFLRQRQLGAGIKAHLEQEHRREHLDW